MNEIQNFLVFQNLRSTPPASQRKHKFLYPINMQNVEYYLFDHLFNIQYSKNKLKKSKAVVLIYYVDGNDTSGDLLQSLSKVAQNASELLPKTLIFCVGRSQFYSFKFFQNFVNAVKKYKVRVRFGTLEQLSDIGDQMTLIGDKLSKSSVKILQKSEQINHQILLQIDLMKNSNSYTFIQQIEQFRLKRMDLIQNRKIKIQQYLKMFEKSQLNLRTKIYGGCIRRFLKHKQSYNLHIQQMNSISKIIQKMKNYGQKLDINSTLKRTIDLTLQTHQKWLKQSQEKIIKYNQEHKEKGLQLQNQIKIPKIVEGFITPFIQQLRNYCQDMQKQYQCLLNQSDRVSKKIKYNQRQIQKCQKNIKQNQQLLSIQNQRKECINKEIQTQIQNKDKKIKQASQKRIKIKQQLKIDNKQMFNLFQKMKKRQVKLSSQALIDQVQIEKVYNKWQILNNISKQEAIDRLNSLIELNTKKKIMRPQMAGAIDEINNQINQNIQTLKNKINQQEVQKEINQIKIQIGNKKQRIQAYASIEECLVTEIIVNLNFNTTKMEFQYAEKLFSLQEQGKNKEQIITKFKEDLTIEQIFLQKISSQFLLAINQEQAHNIDEKFTIEKQKMEQLKQFISAIENDRKSTNFELYKIIWDERIWKQDYQQKLKLNKLIERNRLINQIEHISRTFDKQKQTQNYEKISSIILQYISKMNLSYQIAKIEQKSNIIIQNNKNQIKLMPDYRWKIQTFKEDLKANQWDLTTYKTIQFLIQKLLLNNQRGIFYKSLQQQTNNIKQKCQQIVHEAVILNNLYQNLLHVDTYKKHEGEIEENDDMVIFKFLLQINQKLMSGNAWNQPVFGDEILEQSNQFEGLNYSIISNFRIINQQLQTLCRDQQKIFIDKIQNRVKNLTTLLQIQKNNKDIL